MASTIRIICTVTLALLASACPGSSDDDSDGGSHDESSHHHDVDAGTADGGSPGAQPREPVSIWKDGVPDAGSYCYVIVEAECDGPEDCAEGQSCCGIINGGSLAYESLGCQDTCDSANGGTRLCHPDPEFVATDGGVPAPGCATQGHICRRSIVLPAYMTICAAPLDLAPTELVGTSVAEGEVRCGSDDVCGVGERCCMLGGWDATTRAQVQREGKCVAGDQPCACEETSP